MVNADEAAGIALALPGTQQSAHFDVVDFRVRNKIFCTLPRPGVMVVRLDVAEQAALLAQDPQTFSAPDGAYGRKGWTTVALATVDQAQLQELITEAWRRLAPKKLLAELDHLLP